MKKMNTGQWVERALGQCFLQMTWVGRTSLRRWHVSREEKGVRGSQQRPGGRTFWAERTASTKS